MRDNVTCEEVFEMESGFDDVEVEEVEEVCWCKFFESCPSCFGRK